MTNWKSTTLVVAVALAAWFVPLPASAQVTEEQARKQVADDFGVRVLKVRRGTIAGKPVFLVTVMNPRGARNAAFQVNVLAVEVATGRLVSGFRHGRSRRFDNQAPTFAPNRQGADGMRQGLIWR